MKKWTKNDFKEFFWVVLFILIFFILILGPKPYWLDGGGVILR